MPQHVTMFRVKTGGEFKRLDRLAERLHTGTKRAVKQVLAPKDVERYGGIPALIGEIRAKARQDRLREIVAAEHAAGIYYCRICEEECTNGCCPVHGRQYGVRS